MTVLYDPMAGVFTRNGLIAGTVNGQGYVQIKIDGHLYLAHRLAWRIITGDWPKNDIDHKNRNKLDNRFVNLREATGSQNLRNRGKQRNNKSGFKGVSWNTGRKAWLAMIHDGTKNKNLGYFATRETAAKAYDRAALQYHGEFAKPNFPQRRNEMTEPEDFIHMPIPASMFGAVCALLGGVAGRPQTFMPQTLMPQAPAPLNDKPEPENEDVQVADDDTVDAAGWPWDPALHASTKGVTKDGLWRMKVGVSRPDPKPGFPKETGGTGTKESSQEVPAAIPAAGEDEDEFAAFRAAADKAGATDAAAAASIPACRWTDADLGALCNQAAVKLGDPAPVKAIIAEFSPAGEVPHSRNIPDDQRDAFAKAVEAKAGITFAG